MTDSFWDTSWESVDPKRIAEYLEDFRRESDPLLPILRRHGGKRVCDAGCGCGIYARLLADEGFQVSGFDVSARAVAIARSLLAQTGGRAELKTASILSTGYPDGAFDCALARDVLDHLPHRQAIAAMAELCRITRPGGLVIVTLDSLDEEYLHEPHTLTDDGDYAYTAGKWKGMVFHPYTPETAPSLLPAGLPWQMQTENGTLTLLLHP